MVLGVLERDGRRLDMSQELDSFRDEFFNGVPDSEMEKLTTELACLHYAFGKAGLFYLDDWTSEASRTFEKIQEEDRFFPVSIEDFRKTMHRYIHFIHERRPFKNGLPL